jgi:hypothetical protein
MRTLAQLAADMAHGRTTAQELIEECLAQIADPAGEGARTTSCGECGPNRRGTPVSQCQ